MVLLAKSEHAQLQKSASLPTVLPLTSIGSLPLLRAMTSGPRSALMLSSRRRGETLSLSVSNDKAVAIDKEYGLRPGPLEGGCILPA